MISVNKLGVGHHILFLSRGSYEPDSFCYMQTSFVGLIKGLWFVCIYADIFFLFQNKHLFPIAQAYFVAAWGFVYMGMLKALKESSTEVLHIRSSHKEINALSLFQCVVTHPLGQGGWCPTPQKQV